MTQTPTNSYTDPEYYEAQKRLKKIKGFYKNLANWAGVSIFLLAINFFTTGGITWAKFPVFFWGLSIVMQVFEIIRLQRMDKDWEDRQMRRFTSGRRSGHGSLSLPETDEALTDYSVDEALPPLKNQEKEKADLSTYRKLAKPWKDEDLV
jgi:hypothetical protein